ncbi:MAG TPA: amino acid adenylation domain-containing protein [Candidatus Deferrimicrobium sp.]|nr:amino acid adenylation domain-containing protein [Candidatus Deferrimicrobium sp.]
MIISYRELHEQSGRLAGLLLEKGVEPGVIVAIMVERSLELIIGILGILKSGAAYLPIDTSAPQERVDYMLKDSGANILIMKSEIRNLNFEFVSDFEFRASNLNPSNLAYVIYTSGSTGKPKGVPITYANLSPLLHWGYRHLGLGTKDRFLQNLSYYFDWSVWEIFIALTTGASLYMVPKEFLLNPEACVDFMNRNDITVLHVTPTQYQYYLKAPEKPWTLKYLFIGAEKLSKELAERSFESVNKDCRVFNMYGPTECTIISAVLEIERAEVEKFAYLSSVPIGKAVGNIDLLILDRYLNLCPVNAWGELYITGDCVARGYLNNPGLTAEKFIKSFAGVKGGLFQKLPLVAYKTGDLARRLPGGNVEFLGRIDQQVKIRGFRIELGEIESELLKYNLIKEAVVIDIERENGEPYLCAYIVEKEKFDLPILKDYLAKNLPDYMIPSYFIRIPVVPLNPNGKLDRSALPVIEVQTRLTAETYIPLANEIEARLVALWAEVLDMNRDKISMADNFFELGGHSLKATILSAKIHKIFNIKIPLVEIFRLPTVREAAQYLEENLVVTGHTYTAVEPVEKKEYYPLSSAQRRLYILQRMAPQGTVYNINQVQPLSITIDKERLTETFKQLIRRHESLRTSFCEVNEEPVQKIHDEVEFEIEYYDLATDTLPQHGQTRTFFIRSFDLSSAPLLRVAVGGSKEGKYLLMVDMHHIISDGVSQEVLLKEFLAIYDGISLSMPRLQYKDFAEWQNRPEQQKALKDQEQYWLAHLAGELPVMNLPYDYPRPEVQGFEGSHKGFYLDPEATAALKALAAREDVTLYMVLLAAFNLFSARLSGQEDVIVGVPVAGRSHADIQQIIGMFVNTLAVRNYPVSDKPVMAFLKEVKTNALGSFENQDYPFEDLVEKLTVVRDVSRNPIFDVVFVLQNLSGQKTDPDSGAMSNEYESKIAKFDMTLFAVETVENLSFSLEYCTRLFKEDTIERFISYFKNIMNAIITHPFQPIGAIDMLTEAEKRRLLVEFNDTASPYPHDKTIHQLFAEQAARMPDHIALVGADPRIRPSLSVHPVPPARQVQLSYCESNEQSNRLAVLLLERGLGPDSIAAIMIERSIEMIIGIFGILKAGGAYLPIDPGYPRERIDYMLKDSGAGVLINKSEIRISKFETNPNDQKINDQNKNQHFGAALVLNFENLNLNSLKGCPRRGLSNFNSSNLAYIIYTSGSTGMPKGVMIEHRSVVNRLNWMQKAYPIDSSDVILQKTAFTFDVSVWELFWWSFQGACVSLLGPGEEKDPAAIVKAIVDHRVTTMHFVPSMLNAFLSYLENDAESEAALKKCRLKQVFASGEALGPGQVERFYRLFAQDGAQEAKLINLYGPTEATVDVSYFNCLKGENYKRIPIGKPIDNISLYVLDKNLHLQPMGVAGELHIAGIGLARGYLNRPGLTTSKFVRPSATRNPFEKGFLDLPKLLFNSDSPITTHQSPLYQTGDLARWLKDGNIEYLGRIDHQVKIRGFRIELGEIENRLLAEPAVKEAVVMAQMDRSGDPRLAAYVVPDETTAFTVHRLLEIEENKLEDRPYYELPNGMPVFYLNRNETDFMYREIFVDCSYLKHGITLKPGACIFDIGANIGMFSLFAHHVCPDATIYSFEPVPALYELMALNTSLYGTNFKTSRNGISSKEEEVIFTYYPHASILSGRFADDAEEKETVRAFIHHELEASAGDRPSEAQIDELLAERIAGIRFNCAMKTISQVMRENGVEQIDLLKIDVEKAELDVLEGIDASDWPKIKQLVIEVHDSGGRLEKIMALLEKHHYKVALEQDNMLEETALYNLYAIQDQQAPGPEPTTGKSRPRESGYFSPGRLIDDLRESLKGRLPDYMIPSHFVLLDKMPLTASGKVNKKALPAPGVKRGEGYEAPGNEIEEKLVNIWSEILSTGKENISVTARFFDLGGHSLKATVMVARIYREFAVHVPLVQVFNTPTIRDLAEYLKDAGGKIPVKEEHPLVILKKGPGSAPARLFLMHDGSGEVEGYVDFCRRLELDIDCWGIHAEKLPGYAPLNLSIETITKNYIEKIKILQPQGPYQIAGWSLGGTIAFEMAYQLEAKGETVSFLGLIDSPGPAPVPASLTKEKFTAGSERVWLGDYIPNEQMAKKLKRMTNIDKIWAEVIAYLEENHYPVEKVRQLIPAYLAEIIPGYERLGLRELIYYLNLGRSLRRARDMYIPQGKIHAKLHYFKAGESIDISPGAWAEYCDGPMNVYEISGSHYSILKMPGVEQTVQLFQNSLSPWLFPRRSE